MCLPGLLTAGHPHMHMSYHFCTELKQSAQMQKAERVMGAVGGGSESVG